MRLSVVLLGVSLLGVLAGGWLTGRLGFGCCVIADSVALGFYALARDDGRGEPEPRVMPGTVRDVLEKARRSA